MSPLLTQRILGLLDGRLYFRDEAELVESERKNQVAAHATHSPLLVETPLPPLALLAATQCHLPP